MQYGKGARRTRGRRFAGLVGVTLSVFAGAACKLTLTPPASTTTTIGGVVTDSTGTALAGAKVKAGTSTTTTGTNGRFSFTAAPQI